MSWTLRLHKHTQTVTEKKKQEADQVEEVVVVEGGWKRHTLQEGPFLVTLGRHDCRTLDVDDSILCCGCIGEGKRDVEEVRVDDGAGERLGDLGGKTYLHTMPFVVIVERR